MEYIIYCSYIMINWLHAAMSCYKAIKKLGQNRRCYMAKPEFPWFADVGIHKLRSNPGHCQWAICTDTPNLGYNKIRVRKTISVRERSRPMKVNKINNTPGLGEGVTSSIYGIRSYAKLGFFGGRHGTTWGQLPSLHIRGPGFAYAKLIPGPPVSLNHFDKQTCWLLRSACL